MSKIKGELQKGYRKTKRREPTGEMVGLGHDIDFFNVAFIGMDVFKLRGGKE